MIGVLACFAINLVVFTLVALADKRWPDRLSRRGRRLAAIPVDSPRRRARRSSHPPPGARQISMTLLDFDGELSTPMNSLRALRH